MAQFYTNDDWSVVGLAGSKQWLYLPIVLFILIAIHLTFRKVLRALLRVNPTPNMSLSLRDRVLLRYQNGSMYPWMFAWTKTRLDTMFQELPEFVKLTPDVRVFMDLGCGFGIAGAFLLESFGNSEIYAIDPSGARVRVAAGVFGDRGHVFQAAAPEFEFPEFPDQVDAVFCLDVVHMLSDAALDMTLHRIRARLGPRGVLYLRAPVKPSGTGSLSWHIHRFQHRLTRSRAHHREVNQLQDRIVKADFKIVRSQMSGANAELWWFIARPIAS
jgi:uncharacterized protein